jgi:MFS family permease
MFLLYPDWLRHEAIIVISGFVVMFTTCGQIFTFGVYQALYETMAKEQDTPFTGNSSAKISLIGTLGIALMSLGGPLAMAWSKVYSPRLVIIAGSITFGIGYILASFSKTLWQFAITQGILCGIGTCLSYVPTMAVAPTWFNKHRALAMGIIISGSGVGGMIWPPVLRALITKVGVQYTLRISACITILITPLAGWVLKWEPTIERQVQIQTQGSSRSRRWTNTPLVNWQVASSRRFIVQAVGSFLQSAAYSTPLFYLAAFARSLGYSENTAANFITLSNAANFASRIVIGWAADRFGRLNALFVTTLLTAVAIFTFWLPSAVVDPTSGSKANILFIVFVVFYGCFASTYISLFPASLIELFGVQHYTSINGALYLVRGIGALLGIPLTGLLIPTSSGLVSANNYDRAALTCGVLLFTASIASLWLRIEVSIGSRWHWKA